MESLVQRPRWVAQGSEFHEREEQLWQRRDLSRFQLKQGKRYYNLSIRDEGLSMHGIADMVIETEQQVFAIEFKLTASAKKRGDVLQLVAYAMLLEKHFDKKSSIGFLVGQGRVLHRIAIDKSKRMAINQILINIQAMLKFGLKPDSSATANQCCNCEYLNYCNDRL